ncbi:glycogen synthase GlgA [Candidatus Desantisbacteria bacterium CG_4_9_14_3_um_filter_40_11]|uniref:Glycogen synthase n=3 Tax=unclassified Candidatus Desantisiibacteriota TaxID=3106372 RepID=A0A2M7P314_9BACT|nr:MAG: glycogen synthase GlgA [Candidatus Desantisbacteria bacterium CG23_combo_of_CG06-09_8_20_14_all_40_23]PIY19997.1 MAG: glycogen synthase GlgA [Candidatus Desantisbacteria bacterium CG_4_10_14_3_um_filter_40_18]PJB29983.1 MAG: glycogen synthase GlgA [Candidatus Desantisbacteria bacterium CG_4_9_14_3_um_filter_40_11]
MKILIVSSEAVPFAKTGGLADVTGALPLVLAEKGHDARLVLPHYAMTKKWLADNPQFVIQRVSEIDVPIKGTSITGVLEELKYKNITVYFIKNDDYYLRDELYSTKTGDYEDNAERFIFFSRAVLRILKIKNWLPDIIHLNDWQTASIPLFLKTVYKDDPFYSKIATVLTIHNLGYQGIFSASELELFSGVNSAEIFTMDKLEFYGKINLLKAGIVYADIVNTVSPRYAQEIQTPEYGYGLDGVLRQSSHELYGIINGIDYDVWNPLTDKEIIHHYCPNNIENKMLNKLNLLNECHLGEKIDEKTPLIGLVGRLASQKGLDILAEIFEPLLKMNIRLILLGSGEEKYHSLLQKIAKKYQGKISVNFGYNEGLAHRIYASSDMFLMPSHYEPCGLGQLISLRYGTVPIIRETGGLFDTIEEFEPLSGKGNGFTFTEYSGKALLQTIKRACYIYQHKTDWGKCVLNGINQNYSWTASALEYIKLYRKVATCHREHRECPT